jgi:hypothetical protein
MSSRDEAYPAIPEPLAEVRALAKSVRVIKAVVELLVGVRGSRTLQAVTRADALAALRVPLPIPGFSRTSLPPARDNKRGLVFVTDGTHSLAFSDGFDWKYINDGAVVNDSTVADGDGNTAAGDSSGGQ